MKIAIVKISALGDIVNTMFVLQFIRNKYPLSEIDFKFNLDKDSSLLEIKNIIVNER